MFITYPGIHADGCFDDDCGISCIILCDSGEYYYIDEIDTNSIKEPNMKEYKKMLENKFSLFL